MDFKIMVETAENIMAAFYNYQPTSSFNAVAPTNINISNSYNVDRYYDYIENNYTTTLTKDKLSKLLIQYPDLSKINLIQNLVINRTEWIATGPGLAYNFFDTEFEKSLNKKLILNTFHDQASFYNHIFKFKNHLYNEFVLRENYSRNPYDLDSKIYFKDLIVKNRCKLVEMLEETADKKTLLKILSEDNNYNLNDFSVYNWEKQINVFLWSFHNKTYNYMDSDCNLKKANIETISINFNNLKNKELVELIWNFENKLDMYNFKGYKGKSVFNKAKPENYLVGLMYDDALNIANLKTLTNGEKTIIGSVMR